MSRKIPSAQGVMSGAAAHLLPRQEEAHSDDDRGADVYSSQHDKLFRTRNLECADNGGALDFLRLLGVSESKTALRCACRRNSKLGSLRNLLHNFAGRARVVESRRHVCLGDDPLQAIVLVDDGNAPQLILFH